MHENVKYFLRGPHYRLITLPPKPVFVIRREVELYFILKVPAPDYSLRYWSWWCFLRQHDSFSKFQIFLKLSYVEIKKPTSNSRVFIWSLRLPIKKVEADSLPSEGCGVISHFKGLSLGITILYFDVDTIISATMTAWEN